jgi:hypothetical protein
MVTPVIGIARPIEGIGGWATRRWGDDRQPRWQSAATMRSGQEPVVQRLVFRDDGMQIGFFRMYHRVMFEFF